jgi:hypothetical protein
MNVKLDSASLPKLYQIKTDGLEGFDLFGEYYKAFSNLINLLIEENANGYLQPMLRMFADVTNFYERCLRLEEAYQDDVDNYVDGIKYVFEECAPEGYVFNGTEYVLDG